MSKKSSLVKAMDKQLPAIGRLARKATTLIPDKLYLSLRVKRHLHQKMDWKNPQTFNQKIQWLKVNWREPLTTLCSDKYAVREYIKEKIGEEYLIECYGAFSSIDEINFDRLPQSFVLKGTHGSGMNILCKDKSKLDWDDAKKKLKRWLKTDYSKITREWAYKNIQPKIIFEKYEPKLADGQAVDYKFLCFNGEPKCLFLCLDRYSDKGLKVDFYDMDWQKMPFERHYPHSEYVFPKPDTFDEMVNIAKILSKDFPFVRVDLYEIDGKVYFGELTFFPGSGMEEFRPEEYDKIIGDWIKLPPIKK